MRPLCEEDAAALYPTLSNEEQCRYLSRAAFASQEELWSWLSDPTWPGLTWIAQAADGSVAGRFVTMPAHEDGVEEIGYITCIHAQGQGVARECTAAMIAHRFEQGTRKLTAVVDTRNTGSIRLIEALGFTREAHLREHETTHIGVCDVYLYGLLAREWSA